MLKRFFLFILFIFNLILLINFTYGYNSSYSNITIEPNWWCVGLKVPFQVYNSSEYNNETFKDNLCSYENDTNCFNYSEISGKYYIYAGPMDSFPVLKEGEILDNKFEYTFNEPNLYLIEIEPDGRYNKFDYLFEAKVCKHSKYNLSYNYSDENNNISIKYYNSVLKEITPKIIIRYYDDKEKSLNNLSLNGDISKKDGYNYIFKYTILNISDDSGQYDYFNFVDKINKSYYKGFNYLYVYKNSSNKEYKKVKEINLNEFKNVNLNNLKGSVSILFEFINETKIKIKVNNTKKNQTNLSSSLTKEEKEDNKDDLKYFEEAKIVNENSNSKNYGLIFFIVLVLSIFGYFIYKFNRKPKLHNEEDLLNQPNLSSYSEQYETAKNYINQYKNKYSKEILKVGLQRANIPQDIIEKVIKEEYNN
jgi:hypothetical protein